MLESTRAWEPDRIRIKSWMRVSGSIRLKVDPKFGENTSVGLCSGAWLGALPHENLVQY